LSVVACFTSRFLPLAYVVCGLVGWLCAVWGAACCLGWMAVWGRSFLFSWVGLCVKVAAVARTNVVTCTPSTPLREVVELMVERGVGVCGCG